MSTKELIIISTISLFLSLSVAAQPAFHVALSDVVIDYGQKNANLGILSAPVYGMASHLAADKLIGESSLDYQVELGGVRLLVMLAATPDEQKGEMLWRAFWAMFPDLWDKSTGRKDFHPAWNSEPVFVLNRGETDVIEELSVLSYTVGF